MSEHNSELHKEFELERLILFSDAVFAIAITILIIEIKFPEVEKGATTGEIFKAFTPTLIQFGAFVLSFFFIGQAWMRHLQLFRYLLKYNMGLIRRNLIFLFFIVSFPFSASGITEHIRPGFMLPLIIYFFNIAAVTVCQYLITHYIFIVKPQLCTAGYETEKKYLLLSSKWTAIALGFTAFLYVLFLILFPQNSLYTALPPYVLLALVLIIRRRLRNYKPASMKDM